MSLAENQAKESEAMLNLLALSKKQIAEGKSYTVSEAIKRARDAVKNK